MKNVIYGIIILAGLFLIQIPSGAQDKVKEAGIENQLISAVGKYNEKDLDGAETLLKSILAEAPENDAAWYWSALVSLGRNNAADAETFLKKASELDFSKYPAGQVFFAAGNLKGAGRGLLEMAGKGEAGYV